MAKAFSSGQSFMFANDPKVYVFILIKFHGNEPVIVYADGEDEMERIGYYLSDLIHA